MKSDHEHSSVKILNSLGEDTERTKGILTLSDFINDNNKVIGELLDYTKDIPGKVSKIADEKKAILLLEVEKLFTTLKDKIEEDIRREIKTANNWLTAKITSGVLLVSGGVSWAVGQFYSVDPEAVEQLITNVDSIMVSMGLK